MMLVHMEVHLKGCFSMSISLQKYTVWGVPLLKFHQSIFKDKKEKIKHNANQIKGVSLIQNAFSGY